MRRFTATEAAGTRLALAVIAAAFVAWSAAFIWRSSFITLDGQRYYCLFDDAMISMSYAWNLSHGQGLVWNPGERVQGYTNLLTTLLMSVATRLLSKPLAVAAVQVGGIATMLGIAVVTARLVRRLRPALRLPGWVTPLAFVGALAYYPLAYWTLMGMETGLLTLLLLLAVEAALGCAAGGRTGDWLRLGVWLGLACLARNDAILFAGVLWGYLLFGERGRLRQHWPRLAAAIGVTALFVMGEVLFRRAYYSVWLPNTYTLKLAGMPLAFRLGDGVGFVLPFLLAIAPLLLVILSDLRRRPARPKFLFLALFLTALAYQIYVGGDAWAYWRLLAPAMPLLLLLVVIGLEGLLAALAVRRRAVNRGWIVGGVTLGLLLALVWVNRDFLYEASLYRRPYQAAANRENVNVALALQQVASPEASVGVFWAGAIPYYTGLRAVDFLGKSDPTIANRPPDRSGSISWSGMRSVPGHNKYDLYYSIVALQPTYVQGLTWGQQDLTAWGQAHYVPVAYQSVALLLLRDSPDVDWERLDFP